MRQLEEKSRDVSPAADWLIVEGSGSLCGQETRDANGDILTIDRDDLLERQRVTIRELRSEIECLKEKADGNPILELLTGRRYSDMEAQLASVTEKLEHFRTADSKHTREIAALTSKLEATQMEAERAMSQLRQAESAAAQLKKRGQSQQGDAADDMIQNSELADCGMDCSRQRSHNEHGASEVSRHDYRQ